MGLLDKIQSLFQSDRVDIRERFELLWWLDLRRIPPGHCPHCGYDLTGNVSGKCPECGAGR